MDAGLRPADLDAARHGDGRAFERLFRALAPAVQGYLRAQGATDPDGSTNETFLRVHRRLSQFDGGPASFRSWVFVIAHNLALDERRWTRRRPRQTAVETVPESPAHRRSAVDAGDAGDEALARLAEQRLRALLDLLSPEQRDVLLLRFLADLSLVEVAAATGLSVTAVKARQRRGLDALRRLLREIEGRPVSRSPEPTLTEA